MQADGYVLVQYWFTTLLQREHVSYQLNESLWHRLCICTLDGSVRLAGTGAAFQPVVLIACARACVSHEYAETLLSRVTSRQWLPGPERSRSVVNRR